VPASSNARAKQQTLADGSASSWNVTQTGNFFSRREPRPVREERTNGNIHVMCWSILMVQTVADRRTAHAAGLLRPSPGVGLDAEPNHD